MRHALRFGSESGMTVLPVGSEQRLELFKVGNDHILSGFYQASYEPFFFLDFKVKVKCR